MLVKICGIQTCEAASTAAEAGADMIGFVFAPSKRQVTPETAKTIAACIPATVKKVGVFVDASPSFMQQIAMEVGLDYLQLHGQESPAIAKKLSLPVIKAFPNHQINDQIATYPCEYVLIDGTHPGSGNTFDWQLLDQLPVNRNKLLLAGGLAPDNVQQAIRQVQPIGVDTSSGVEINGQKDSTRIQAFIQTAKAPLKEQTFITREEDCIDNLYNANKGR